MYPGEAEYSLIANSYVNPLTVVGLQDQCEKDGHKAYVQTAAASSLGKMLIRHCLKKGVQLINVVRREEQVKAL